MFVKAPCIWGFSKFYDKKGEVGSDLVEPVTLAGSVSRRIFWDEMSDDGLLALGKALMDTIYDIDTKAIIPPLESHGCGWQRSGRFTYAAGERGACR